MKVISPLKVFLVLFFVSTALMPEKTTAEDALAQCKRLAVEFSGEFTNVATICKSRNRKADLKKCLKKQGCSSEECKEYSKEDIENAKEERKDYRSSEKELEEDIEEIAKDILEKEAAIGTLNAEYQENAAKLKSEMEASKADLKADLKEKNQKLDASAQAQINQIQNTLEKALKIRHSFENAISKAGRDRMNSVQGLMQSCRTEAITQMSAYTAKRRAAIRRGSNKTSALKMLSKNRTSLKSKDSSRSQAYYNRCWKQNKHLLTKINNAYKESLKQISQQKLEMMENFKNLQKKATRLNQQAYAQKKSLTAEYAERAKSDIKKFNQTHVVETSKYEAEKKQLIKEITQLHEQKIQKELKMNEQTEKLHENEFLQIELKGSKKAKANMTKVLKAYSAFSQAASACNCESTDPKVSVLQSTVVVTTPGAVPAPGQEITNPQTKTECKNTLKYTYPEGTGTPSSKYGSPSGLN